MDSLNERYLNTRDVAFKVYITRRKPFLFFRRTRTILFLWFDVLMLERRAAQQLDGPPVPPALGFGNVATTVVTPGNGDNSDDETPFKDPHQEEMTPFFASDRVD